MEPKALKLTVPNPCHENWERMQPNERGRYCTNCNKTVIDFSLFTDKQIIEFFTNAATAVCGRFNSYQLNRELACVEPRNHFLYKLLFGTALTLGIAGSASANSLVNMKPLVKQYGLKSEKQNDEPPISGSDSTNYVKGKVIDKETKQPLPFAAVVLLNNKVPVGGAQTDISGQFAIEIPLNLIGKKLKLETVYVGYTGDTIEIKSNIIPLTVELKCTAMILGGPMFISVPIRRDNPSDPFINADKQVIKGDDLH
jgi:hypothetical protein